MQLDDWIQKEPHQFEYFHRMMGYIMLSVVLVVFHYTEPDTQYQLFVPFFVSGFANYTETISLADLSS